MMMDKMSLQDEVPQLQLLQQIFSSYKLVKCLSSVELYPYWLLLQFCYTWLVEQSVRIRPLKANYFAAALI